MCLQTPKARFATVWDSDLETVGVVAVVRPGNLVEQWRVLKACVASDKIIIMQAANTGLTGGSTPDGSDYDRGIVIVSTLRIARIRLIKEGRQVICHSGSTLFQLEKALKPLGREPHSVIGSSCIGASVVVGICNNSGGALIHRGPAYTEFALFAGIDESGAIHLVNHLGVNLGNDPENVLDILDRDAFTESDIEYDKRGFASDHDYSQHVRDFAANTPVRYSDHRVQWARVVLAGDRRASATAASRCAGAQGVPRCADFGKETEVDAACKPSVA
jgi:D-lactate dehydrogenase (quinone)